MFVELKHFANLSLMFAEPVGNGTLRGALQDQPVSVEQLSASHHGSEANADAAAQRAGAALRFHVQLGTQFAGTAQRLGALVSRHAQGGVVH